MRALTLEWIAKADGDFQTALRESHARKNPNYDAACFHCQQSAEKYLKAFLQENDRYFPYTHNLLALLDLCNGLDASFDRQRSALTALDKYAVQFRYPGENAIKSDAKTVLNHLHVIRNFIRGKLSLPLT